MDAILISFVICVLGVMVTVLIFSLAMRPEEEDEQVATRSSHSAEAFFMEEVGGATEATGTATNAILLDLERHLRLEQEAAAAFLEGPTPDSLHAPADSPFWH